jgi:hypothetical protein
MNMSAFPQLQSLPSLSAATISKLSEEKQTHNRERDCLVLIMAHLRSRGYIGTSSELQIEGGALTSQHEPADNIDLISLMKICEEYYWSKFGRKAIFSRKVDGPSHESQVSKLTKSRRASASRRRILHQIQGEHPQKNIIDASNRKAKPAYAESIDQNCEMKGEGESCLPTANQQSNNSSFGTFSSIVTGSSLGNRRGAGGENSANCTIPFLGEVDDSQLFKQYPFGDDLELRALAAAIQRDILQRSPGVSWEDVVELESEFS